MKQNKIKLGMVVLIPALGRQKAGMCVCDCEANTVYVVSSGTPRAMETCKEIKIKQRKKKTGIVLRAC